MAIHGTLGSWLKYGSDVQENNSFVALFLETWAGATIPVRAFSTVGRTMKRWNYPCPEEIIANTISAFEMPYSIRDPIRSHQGRRSLSWRSWRHDQILSEGTGLVAAADRSGTSRLARVVQSKCRKEISAFALNAKVWLRLRHSLRHPGFPARCDSTSASRQLIEFRDDVVREGNFACSCVGADLVGRLRAREDDRDPWPDEDPSQGKLNGGAGELRREFAQTLRQCESTSEGFPLQNICGDADSRLPEADVAHHTFRSARLSRAGNRP